MLYVLYVMYKTTPYVRHNPVHCNILYNETTKPVIYNLFVIWPVVQKNIQSIVTYNITDDTTNLGMEHDI